MKKSKQLSFFSAHQIPKRFFGGALLHGRRKSMRPLSRKDSIHFVLRSVWAMGSDSFLAKKNYGAIDRLITKFAKKFGVRIYRQSINSNHVHLLLRITNRTLYKAFIKALSGQIASHVMGSQSFKLFSESRPVQVKAKVRSEALRFTPVMANSSFGFDSESTQVKAQAGDAPQAVDEAGSPEEKQEGFWQFRPFSRVVSWGVDFRSCVGYLKQNILEAFGFVPYKLRKDRYADWVRLAAPPLSTA